MMINNTPAFLITIDTEPDNQWRSESFDKTENTRFIPRFQDLCEKYGFKPVYLTEYNVARDPFFVDYMRGRLAEGACEIGVHPHAWSTPPFVQITSNDCKTKPFMTEYPPDIMEQKLVNLVTLLRSTFDMEITSHRSGRWALSGEYVRLLRKHGVTIDCSILPYNNIGRSSDESKGVLIDYRDCGNGMYEIDTGDFKKPGNSGVFELPVTVINAHPVLRSLSLEVSSRLARKLFPLRQLRPEPGNLADLLTIADTAVKKKFPYIEFMLHSSELMPGCSPVFASEQSIEALYADLNVLFERVHRGFQGMTLGEYAASCAGKKAPAHDTAL